MVVYLIQHADAVDKSIDPERPISDIGRTESEGMAAFLRTRGLTVQWIWHSGRLRSVQTAEILVPALGGVKPEPQSGLEPKSDPRETAERLDGRKQNVAIIGHLPHLARLAALLTTGDADAEPIAFRNSGVVCLARDDDSNQWRLRWAVTPELL